ncbi:MAG: hypothetical protein KF819_09900 [Labilithrix sp.]|nr:hypothetical protein [Labilithrix sp.]
MRSTLVAIVGLALFGACEPSYAPPSATCSDAPRWPRGTSFEYEHDGPTGVPACTPHCGPNRSASGKWNAVGAPGVTKLTSDALPSGACSEDGVVCGMTAEWLGPCPDEGLASGPLNDFYCRCISGRWSCTVDARAPSATAWECHVADAGAKDATSE